MGLCRAGQVDFISQTEKKYDMRPGALVEKGRWMPWQNLPIESPEANTVSKMDAMDAGWTLGPFFPCAFSVSMGGLGKYF